MRMLYITALLLPLLTTAQIDDELKLYVFSFESYFGVKVDTKVEFGEFQGDAIGVSIKGKNHVIINKEKFNDPSKSTYFRYLVMYHELCHAFFKMGHQKHGLMRADIGLKNRGTALTDNFETHFGLFLRGRKKIKKQLLKH